MGFLLFVLLLALVSGQNGFFVRGERPDSVNIAAVLAYDSVIGRVAKAAIEAAVEDVNANKSVLGGTRLNLIVQDSNCSAFIGSVKAFQVLQNDTVAIIAPESSSIAHMLLFISNGLQIPLVSFAATDPTLSSLQFKYFLRMTQSDSYQMAALADLVDYNGWKHVIAIYVDNDYGRNGIYSLEDELADRELKISYKIALPVQATLGAIADILKNSKQISTRIYVVHANPDSGLHVFLAAQSLQMINDEYVWLATDWLSSSLDSSLADLSSQSYLQGIVAFRQFIPQSKQGDAFASRWNELHRRNIVTSKLNVYGFYAYDAVWAIAHALSGLLEESVEMAFSASNISENMKGKLLLEKLKTFDGGSLLLKKLSLLKFTGLTGTIQFDNNHNLLNSIYEVINIDQSRIHTVGYWSSQSGLSLLLPRIFHENQQRNLSKNQSLGNIVWPGGRTITPRGWVVSGSERPLRIGVPHRASYVEFVTVTKDSRMIVGYCIDVFEAAVKLVPYNIPYQFVPFGDGLSNPNYDELVNLVANNVIDAAVGDIAIVRNRTKSVDFTQPYISTGLVIVAPTKRIKSNAWVFLRPFTLAMWCVTGGFFFLIAIVIWLLEHRGNNDFRGPPKRQLLTMLLFSFSTLFRAKKENIFSAFGRMVMVIWLFVLMVITSSYTASLTSFLTVQQLSSPIKGIDSLIASNEPIGYQNGSFAWTYLRDSLSIHPSRLVSLGSPEAYEAALRHGPKDGGVVAIVDELPYVELFLSNTSGFGIVGRPSRSDWGFAFPRDSPLADDLSRAILRLSEDGTLQKIHQKWFCKTSCIVQSSTSSESNQLDLNNFWGLLVVCGIATIASFLLFLPKAIRQFVRFRRSCEDLASEVQPNESCSQIFRSFLEFIDNKEEAIEGMCKQQQQQNPSQTLASN